jgi:hypothetical protein
MAGWIEHSGDGTGVAARFPLDRAQWGAGAAVAFESLFRRPFVPVGEWFSGIPRSSDRLEERLIFL